MADDNRLPWQQWYAAATQADYDLIWSAEKNSMMMKLGRIYSMRYKYITLKKVKEK